MNKLISWMTDNVAPKLNKFANNPWVASVQDGYMKSMPLILTGSFSIMFMTLKKFLPSWFPDLSNMYNFSIGLLGLFLAYLIPRSVMERKKYRRLSIQAGLLGICVFLILVNPGWDDNGNILISFERLGGMGSLVSIIAGLGVALVMNFSAKHPIFSEDSPMPPSIQDWFQTLLPCFVCIFVAYNLTFTLNFDIYRVINDFFKPLINIGESFWGFVIMYGFGFCFVYAFGISPWVIGGITNTICFQGSAQNYALVAQGLAPTWINSNEVMNWVILGGSGATLALSIMILRARSKKLKALGKTCIVPSFLQINEPLVYGLPIAMNPILMIPFVIAGFVVPAIVYFAFSSGLVPIPGTPSPAGFIVIFDVFYKSGIPGVLLLLTIFAFTWALYYPFYKIYDKQVVDEEKLEEEKKLRTLKREEGSNA